MEAGVRQRERSECRLVQVLVERSAADPPDHLGEQDEAGVAVLERSAGRIIEWHLGDGVRGTGKAGRDHGVRGIGGEPGAMGQEPSDRDLIELLVAELLEVSSKRRVELDGPPLYQANSCAVGSEGLGWVGMVDV